MSSASAPLPHAPAEQLPSSRRRQGVELTWNQQLRQWNQRPVTFCCADAPFSEGNLRKAYLIKFDTLDPVRGQDRMFVMKVAKDLQHPVEQYERDVKTQLIAAELADAYNMQIPAPPKTVKFLEAFMLQCPDMEGITVGVEAYVPGEFKKFNNNWDWAEDKRNTPQAFSHWTLKYTNGRYLVCDIQGVGDVWTDPQIHTSYNTNDFGLGNCFQEGIDKFMQSHRCNPICRHLGLTPTSKAVKDIIVGGTFVPPPRNSLNGVPGVLVSPAALSTSALNTFGTWDSFGGSLCGAAAPAASGFCFGAVSEQGFGVGAAFGGPFGPPVCDNALWQERMQVNDALAPLRGKMIKVKRTTGAVESDWQLASDARVDADGKVNVMKGDLTRSTLLQELLSINGFGSALLPLGEFSNTAAAVAPACGFGEGGWAGFGAPSSEGEFSVKDAFGGSSFGSPAAAMPSNAAAQQAPFASSRPSLRPSLYLLEPTDDMTDQYFTMELLRDPVFAVDGFTYERASIEAWFASGNTTSPKTGAQLPSLTLIPNHDLRARVQEWQAQRSGQDGNT